MLIQLNISNFAIIEHLEINLSSGLNIISGETGAGKSIIINAVNLILGKRASTELIRSNSKEATVEALFCFPHNRALSSLLNELDIPFESELLIKRSISHKGRNKILINGTIATLQILARLGMKLISISSQHEHQLLLNPENHLFLLDSFAGLIQEKDQYSRLFTKYQSLNTEIKQLEQKISQTKEKQDLIEFQANEIEQAQLTPDEDEVLTRERIRLQHANELMKTLSRCYYDLYENKDSALALIARCSKEIDKAAQIDQNLVQPKDILEEIKWKTEDVAMTIRDVQRSIRIDPQRLEQINERLELLNRLKRKYGKTIRELIKFKEGLISNINDLEDEKRLLEKLKEKRDSLLEKTIKAAEDLSKKRKESALSFEKALEKELDFLNMKETQFKVCFKNRDENRPSSEKATSNHPALSDEGLDQIEFMFSSNIGEDLKPLAKIASGGELSRIVLAIKTLLARSASVETIIFDEVDSGISGPTAAAVGEKLVSLARYHQLICISHLPQIASKGETHFHVRKEVRNGRTHTILRKLDFKERTNEIARLLGGRKITKQALENAKDMLIDSTNQ